MTHVEPEKSVDQNKTLSEEEYQQIIFDWNDTAVEYPDDLCVHQLFEEQVARTPDAVAVVFNDQSLTYRQLNEQANQWAHYLVENGVISGDLVGFCIERSSTMVTLLLGILKAGACYIPLDPGYPDTRLSYMVEHSRLKFLITLPAFASRFHRHQVKILDLDNQFIHQCRQSNPQIKTGGDELAYVIYTSGSTGKPKGVCVQHSALRNFLESMRKCPGMRSDDRILAVTTISFDIAVLELFLPLICGATTIIAERKTVMDANLLKRLIEKQQINFLQATPSTWRTLLASGWKPRNRFKALCGGEAFPDDLARQLVHTVSHVWNMYGPTETTVWSSCYQLTSSESTIYIGRPIDNTRFYILDTAMQVLPAGVPGELYIGGLGVTRGYLYQEQLTAERFVSDPFSSEADARLYRTGDRVRYLPDGNIEFLGRLDHQVKLRGIRIELGEIEAALMQHAVITNSLVTLREDRPGDKRLVAYLTADPDLPDTAELRMFLGETLPGYMLPSAFVTLKEFPLTPNGKIDRAALPAPDQSRAEESEHYIAPRSPMEEMLADLWAEVLNLERVGIHDNFFEQGGDSLLAMQLVVHIGKDFNTELPIHVLFEQPTIAQLGYYLEALPKQAPETPLKPIETVSRAHPIAASFAQQRLWFLDQLMGANSTYNIPWATRLKGHLDVPALRRSINTIVQRHEVLRTCFSGQDDTPTPLQIIRPALPIDCQQIDLQSLPKTQREAEAQRVINQEGEKSFDLEHGPLLRALLVKLAEDEHILLLTIHHIVVDGWSLGILSQELNTFYTAFSQDQPSPLTKLPLQYADYAVWQRSQLQGEMLEKLLTYWKSQLDSLTVLELPTDFPRPATLSYRGGTESLLLSAKLTRSLKTLSQNQGVTLYMTLLAALQVLLHRYSGQDDICVGGAIAGRNHQQIEGLIGFFVNTLVMRTELSGDLTFEQLLKKVQNTCLEAYAHQELPFEKLVSELQPQRDMSRHPLFQVILVLQNTPQSTLQLPGLSTQSVMVFHENAMFDISISLEEKEDVLTGSIEFATDLFKRETIQRFIGHFKILLEGIVADIEIPIAELPLLTAAEQHQILVQWNDTRVDYPHDQCIHQLFEAQVARTPDAIAVVFEEQQLTYNELNTKANQLAHYLKKRGVGADILVGLCILRSIDMIIGLLAILKAGGAYVPLDPEYPAERLSFMLEDTQVPILLTQISLAERLVKHRAEIICLDNDWEVIGQEVTKNLTTVTNAENLSHVIYTSGSTGSPKGIMIPHCAVVRLVYNTNYINIGAEDNIAQASNISFDAATFEIWGALLNGARLTIIAKTVILSATIFARIIEQQGINTLLLTTALFNQLVQQSPELFNSIKTLLFGGEAAEPLWVEKILRNGGPENLLNLYGPAESTTVTTYYPVVKTSNNIKCIPIGKPIANTQTYILDNMLQPLPVGVAGELYVGGDGLARGYLNRPELTAEKFIPNPFSDEPGARLYKTGDKVSYLPDGNIEFLGRLDNQVKLRGFRIELGEIEAALMQHTAINNAVVTLREDRPGDKRLVAYLTADPDLPDTAELRTFLRETLPDYMLPSAYVFLSEFPLTPNGKIDRAALPAPELSRAEESEHHVAPRSPVEEMLADLWTGLLNLERVGIHDNFFEQGGDSLLAVQLATRISEEFNKNFPVEGVFKQPTIAQLGHYLEALLKQEAATDLKPIETVSRAHPIAASFAQQRLWFLDQLMGPGSTYNIPWATRLKGPLDSRVLKQSINATVGRHEVLRTCFAGQEGSPLQIILPSLQIECPLIDLQSLPERERETEAQRVLDREAETSFDVEHGPLLRALLVKLAGEEHILLITIHHIVMDGWSLEILGRELTALYAAFSQGQPSPLAELPLQYADYAVWQRSQLQGGMLEKLLTYWKRQLADVTTLELPTDYPRPAEQTYRGSRVPLLLSSTLTSSLKALSQTQGVTLYMTLLAALQLLLHRYSGQDDISIGSAIAGRDHQQIEGLIGFFVNTLVMRTQLSGNLTFQQLLKKVQTTCLEAYAHQELPFEKLISELQPQRDMSRNPLFQVMLILQSTPQSTLQLPGLSTKSLTVANESAMFDLLISLEEKAGGLEGEIEYATDLFNRDTIQRLVGHFEILLEGIVAEIDTPIAELPILTQKERYQLLEEWNNTGVDYPRDQCIHQLFEAQAVSTPDGVAVVFNDQSLTYRQLNEQANQWAHYLVENGVISGDLIGFCIERSSTMVTLLLGILKSGACYIPLDPGYPDTRLSYMVEHSRLKFLITLPAFASRFHRHQAKILDLDNQFIHQCRQSNPQIKIGGDKLAYIIYTSGSTGKPKGVCVQHSALRNFLESMRKCPGMSSDDRILAVTTISFDIAVLELFLPLICGASTIIAERKTVMDANLLKRLIEKQQINFLQATPSTWRTLLASGWKPRNRFKALCGGEAFPEDLARQLVHTVSHLWNMYGPTETTVWSSCYQLTSSESTIYIGRPIDNTRFYILDTAMQVLPAGVPGELYIGGLGVARGYLYQEQLTAERFVSDPFSSEADARLYRTGDRVRYLPDGNIEFLGRLDHQVKLRGVRIELGEIEAALMQHAVITNSLVTLREDRPGDKRLVAYLTADPDLPDTAELRMFLGETLPGYMLPSAFVTLKEFPLTPNGKIDRAALPAPDQSRAEESEHYIAPRSPMEEMLADLWAEVLNLERVGIHDNFFEQGGDSLLAVQLAAHISEEFNKNFPVEGVFKHPTIKSQVELLQDFTPAEFKPFTENIITPVRSSGSKTPLFWLFGGKIIPLIYNHIDAEHPFYFLHHQTTVDGKPARYTDIKSMAAYYLQLIQAIKPEGPYILGGFSVGGLIAYEMAQQLYKDNKSVPLLFLLSPSPPGKEFYQETSERLLFLEQERRLNDTGYKAYFADLISRYDSSIRKYIRKIAMHYYLKKDKPLPVWLRSYYIHTIYGKTVEHYQPPRTPLAINKTIIIYEEKYLTKNDFYRQHWQKFCTGDLEFYAFDYDHVELIETSGGSEWIRKLSNGMDACT